MYESFYDLRERPFDLTPDPRYLFLTPAHREALSNLQYGVSTGVGLTVLTGEAGTGKTTLIRAALDTPEVGRVRTVYLNNPTLTRLEFIEFLAAEFDLGADAAGSKTVLLRRLRDQLLELHRRGTRAALIIDEAQSLPDELLEEIRLLANVETNTAKLISLVMVGQPELADRLNQPSLRQLKQRVGLRCQLFPLDLDETAAYITARVNTAGGDAATLFTRDAVIDIHRHSKGIPRVVSVICNNALISGFALEQRPVGKGTVREVCHDFDITAAPRMASPASPAAKPDRSAAALVAEGGSADEDVPTSTDDAPNGLLTGAVRQSRWWGF